MFPSVSPSSCSAYAIFVEHVLHVSLHHIHCSPDTDRSEIYKKNYEFDSKVTPSQTNLSIRSPNIETPHRSVVLLNDFHAWHKPGYPDVIMSWQQQFTGQFDLSRFVAEIRQEPAFFFNQERPSF
jgi:hypothetical protein